MPDMQAALRTRIIDAATVAGSRVSWMERPQGTALPAVTLQVISDGRPQHLKGNDGARSTRIRADCWAATYASALTLARSVIAALAAPANVAGKVFGSSRVSGQQDFGDDVNGTLIHRQSVDLIIWHVGD